MEVVIARGRLEGGVCFRVSVLVHVVGKCPLNLLLCLHFEAKGKATVEREALATVCSGSTKDRGSRAPLDSVSSAGAMGVAPGEDEESSQPSWPCPTDRQSCPSTLLCVGISNPTAHPLCVTRHSELMAFTSKDGFPPAFLCLHSSPGEISGPRGCADRHNTLCTTLT